MYIKKLFKRFAPVIALVAIVITLSILPVSATSYSVVDYSDYIDLVVHENGMTGANINVPDNLNSWHVYPSGEVPFSSLGTDKVTFTQANSGSTSVFFFLFGDSSERTFSLAKIPFGATLAIACEFYANGTWTKLPYIEVTIEYFDSNGKWLGVNHSEVGTRMIQGSSAVFNIPMLYPPTAASFTVRYDMTDWQIVGGEQEIWCEKSDFQLYMDTISWNMYHTTINPTPPVDGSVEDVGDLEQDILNDSSGGRDTFSSVVSQALSILSEYAVAFASIGFIFNCFVRIPFVSHLLYISLMFGCVASLFGIAVQLLRSVKMNSDNQRGKYHD